MKTLLSMACLAPACLLASCVSGQTAPEVSPLVASSSPKLSVTDMPAAAAPAESASAVAVDPVAPAQTQTSTSYGPMAEDWELVIVGTGANSNDFDIGTFSVGANVGYFFSDRSEVGLRQSVGYSDFGDTIWNGSTRAFYDFHILTSSNLKPLIGANIGYVYGENVDETWPRLPSSA